MHNLVLKCDIAKKMSHYTQTIVQIYSIYLIQKAFVTLYTTVQKFGVSKNSKKKKMKSKRVIAYIYSAKMH